MARAAANDRPFAPGGIVGAPLAPIPPVPDGGECPFSGTRPTGESGASVVGRSIEREPWSFSNSFFEIAFDAFDAKNPPPKNAVDFFADGAASSAPLAKKPVSSGRLLYVPASCGPPLPHSGRPAAAAASARLSSARRS